MAVDLPGLEAAIVTQAPATAARTPKSYVPTVSMANFGLYLALLTPVLVSLALKIEEIDPAHKAANLGLVTGVGAFVALVCNPLAGRLSDRTASRFGMRRPWIIGGTVVGVAALCVIGVATSIWLVLIGWCVAQAAFNAVLAAVNATVPDQVPAHRRGGVSGVLGVTIPVGIIGGVALAAALPSTAAKFAVPAVIALVLVPVFALLLKDRRLPHKPMHGLSVKEFFGSFVFNPRRNPDFGWAWLTKFLVMFGYAGTIAYLAYFLTDEMGFTSAEVAGKVAIATGVGTLGMVISSAVGGFLSDRLGKRKPFVIGAGLVMAVGTLLIAFAPSFGVVIVAELIIGLGAGAFVAVDLALVTQVLPNPEDNAKDLGVMNIANALPQSLAPAVAPVLLAIGGYSLYFMVIALLGVAGALLVSRIKGVN